MSRENRWIKLSRGYLRDEKIHYIIKRHGHDTMVVWTGILTECRSGVLEMPEEVFAEVCMIEQTRFVEIIKIFSDFELVTRCNGEKLQVVNWNKYQYSESYDRVKAFRGKDVTAEKQGETFEKQNVASGSSLSSNNLNTSTTKNVPETDVKRFVTQPEDYTLANAIFADIRALNPQHKKPNFEKWADTIRLMRERDGRKHEEILSMWKWANKHSFWSSNILSPEKLREQWDRLVIVIRQQKQGEQNATRQPADNSAVGKVRRANAAREQRAADAQRQAGGPGVATDGVHVRPPLDQ
mgnify:CR=1 FL=1